ILEARARIVQRAQGSTLEEVLRATLDEAEDLTGSCIGFYHFLQEDQVTLTLQAWSTRTARGYCRAEGEGLHYPVNKAGVWVDAIREGRPVIHNDYASLPHKHGLPEGHAELKRELVVPVLRGGRIVAVLGVGNKPFPYGFRDVETVQRLADLAWETVEQKRTQENLRFEEAALEHSLNAVALADLDGTIRYVNPAFVALWRYQDRQACLGMDGRRIWADLEAATSVLSRLVSDGKAIEGEMKALRPDGSSFDVHFTASQARDASGRILGVLGTFLDISASKEAELARRLERENLERYLRAVEVILVAFDAEAHITLLNRKGYAVLGYEEGELEGQDWFRVCLPPEEYETVLAVYRRAIAGDIEPVAEYENHILRKDGERRLIAWHNTMVKDDQGRIIGTLSSGEDITDRRRAEVELETLARLLTETQAIGGLGYYTMDLRTGRWESSALLDDIFGIDAAYDRSVEGWSALVHPDDRAMMVAYFTQEVIGKGLPFDKEYRAVRVGDGAERWLHGHGRLEFDDQQKPIRMIGTIQDITGRKQNEVALSKAAREWTAVLDASSDVIYLLGLDRRIIRANRAFFHATGSSPATAIGMPIDELMHPQGEAVPCPVCRAQVEQRDLRMIMEPEDPNNPVGLPLEITLKVIRDREERPISMLMTLRDLSATRREMEERAALERQLQQVQKLESLGALAGGVAHDMNNVLAAILGLASVSIESQPEGSPVHKTLETIIKAAERGGKMVKSLLSFARQSPAEELELDLNAILREEVHLLERTSLSRVRLEVDLDQNLRPVRGDASALTHAFMNLCVNAVDAMPENGTLTLRTGNVGNQWVEVLVEDTGAGMSPEVLARAMDPFFTTKGQGKGTGLGLSMVYSTVKAHQGEMALESEPGRGTRVRLRFPACEPAAPRVESVQRQSALPPSQSLDILLVDDDELIQSSIQAMLEGLGHRAIVASNGEEALLMLEGGLCPEVVILDMNMPGLGGAGTLPRLRALCPAVPILLATGRSDQSALDLVAQFPKVTLLPKPFGLVELQKQLAGFHRAGQA
ncbi:MAG TPA: PAS domain S-box protein, partial [Geothrix sp.]|nr:PAS domain S-box protein [Geothrix sp.]